MGATGSLVLSGGASAHADHPRVSPADPARDVTYLVAALNGRNEVPGPAGSPAVGDSDGRAVEVLRVKGNQISYTVKWYGIGAPTAGHLHLGTAGTNGAVKVPFFGTALPGTLNAVMGTVTVDDPSLLDSLKSDPGSLYANLHTAEFPGGAVRGQLHKVTHPIDLNAVLRGGPLAAMLDGGQEVETPGKPSGDPEGRATAFLRAERDEVEFAFTWSGIGGPTNGHLHQGVVGGNGPVALDLFAAPGGLPASINGVAGVADDVKADLAKKINQDPSGFYLNLHTAEFTGGAVRGQVFRSGRGAAAFGSSSFVAPVTKGEQIYACAEQADGSFAFTQHNVSARLRGGIAHSFVSDDAGPPRWVARDRSAVTGKVLARIPNGAGNIPELDLDALQTGASGGLLADVVEIARLNTVGGVAPTGTCDPKRQPMAKIPYEADYVFIK
jgi:hypothetical protein